MDDAEMDETTNLPSDLIAAYAATEFRVTAPRQFILRIGKPSVELGALYLDTGATSAAFLTAWNPFSEESDPATNAANQRHLIDRVTHLGFTPWEGMGIDPSGDWAGEESIFVLGIDRTSASALGIEFRQNAIVWVDADTVPQLVLLR